MHQQSTLAQYDRHWLHGINTARQSQLLASPTCCPPVPRNCDSSALGSAPTPAGTCCRVTAPATQTQTTPVPATVFRETTIQWIFIVFVVKDGSMTRSSSVKVGCIRSPDRKYIVNASNLRNVWPITRNV